MTVGPGMRTPSLADPVEFLRAIANGELTSGTDAGGKYFALTPHTAALLVAALEERLARITAPP